MTGITTALKGIGGEFELNRVVGFIGGMAYIVCANVFVGYQVWWLGQEFNIVEYCLAFPGGLATIAGGTAAAISLKDRQVASSKVIEQTGAVPTKPLAGPQVPVGDPPPVDRPQEPDELPEYAR